MPPQVLSDSDSDGDVIPARNSRKAMTVDDDIEDEVENDDDPTEDDEGEEFIVEAIKDHKYEGKQLFLQVKWKGYEKKSDLTWEPEENCEGAKEILMEYYNKIGGRPLLRAPSATKRGRQSTGSVAASASAASKNNKRARTSLNVASSKNGDGASPTPSDDKWKPPAKGNWEDEITAIDTIEKTSKGLVCYVQWNNGRKTQHDIKTVYTRCPQKMLSFYEQHLVFKESGSL